MRWPIRVWWFSTTPSCTTSCSARIRKSSISPNGSITTAYGNAPLAKNCGATVRVLTSIPATSASPCCGASRSARRVIVHNPGARGDHPAANPTTPIEIIPHFCELAAPPDPAVTARFRQRLGINQDATLFGIFGYLREPKRVIQCIETLKKLHLAKPKTALLLAGEVVSNDLARLLITEAAHPAIFRAGHQSDEDFRVAGAAVDCCLNLRYPGVGETSGIAVRLMGRGSP